MNMAMIAAPSLAVLGIKNRIAARHSIDPDPMRNTGCETPPLKKEFALPPSLFLLASEEGICNAE